MSRTKAPDCRLKSLTLPLVILGAGYVGSFLYRQAKDRGHPTFVTSRSPETHLTFALPEDRLYFDLGRHSSWSNIPQRAHLIWCFPALPEETALSFAKTMYDKQCRLVLLGSTSAYPTGVENPINETAPLNLHLPRVKSEERIRIHYDATVLRLAGLYGPGRNVLDWIRKGRIQNTGRFVNLIHVEDAAAICLAGCTEADPGTSYIVSDGTPRQWSEICQVANRRWKLAIPPSGASTDAGKKLSPQKLLGRLKYRLKYPDLYSALGQIEGIPKDHPPGSSH